MGKLSKVTQIIFEVGLEGCDEFVKKERKITNNSVYVVESFFFLLSLLG